MANHDEESTMIHKAPREAPVKLCRLVGGPLDGKYADMPEDAVFGAYIDLRKERESRPICYVLEEGNVLR